MEEVVRFLTPLVIMFAVGLIIPIIFSAERKAELSAEKDSCVCYMRSKVIWLRVFFFFFALLTLVIFVYTILSVLYPEMVGVTSKDIWGIVLVWVLSVGLEILTIIFSIVFTRKICYNDISFTEIRPFNKKKEYFYSAITGIDNTIKIVPGDLMHRKGKLKIYIGQECVKISSAMCGVPKFIKVLHSKCKDIKFN